MSLDKKMADLLNFGDALEKKDCSRVASIKDINDKYDYDDEYPDGEGDSNLVACGQSGSYNELAYIYRAKLRFYVNITQEIAEEEAIKALCEACRELPNPRKRTDFYKLLSEKLGVSIK